MATISEFDRIVAAHSPENAPQLLADVVGARKAFEDRGERSVLGSVFGALEQLRRGQAGVFKAATGIIEGDGILRSLAAGAMEIVKFEDRLTFADVMNAGGVSDFRFRGVVEFLGDVIFDPLWLAGPVPKLGRALGLTGKALSVAERGVAGSAFHVAGRYGWKGIEALERVGAPQPKLVAEKLQKAFTGAITKAGKETQQILRRANELSKQEAKKFGIVARNEDDALIAIAKRFDVDVDEVRKALTFSAESKAALAGKLSSMTATEALITTAGLPPQAAKKYLNFNQLSKALREGGDFNPRTFANLPDNVWEALESSGLIEQKAGRFAAVAESERTFRKKLRERGLKVEELGLFQSERLEYVTHLTHPQARDILINELDEFRALGRTWNSNHASLLDRTIGKEMSIAEANALSLQGRLPATSKLAVLNGRGVPLLIDNPAAIEAIRGYRSARTIAAMAALDEVTQKYGVRFVRNKIVIGSQSSGVMSAMLESARATQRGGIGAITGSHGGLALKKTDAGLQALTDAGFRQIKVKGFEQYHLPKEAAQLVNAHFADPVPFLKGWNTVQDIWKAHTLAVFPAYHSRNFVSNQYLNWAAGMSPLEMGNHMVTAIKAMEIRRATQHAATRPGLTGVHIAERAATAAGGVTGALSKRGVNIKTLDDKIRLGPHSITVRDLLDKADSQGVFQGGFYIADLNREGQLAQAAGGSVRGAMRQAGRQLRAGQVKEATKSTLGRGGFVTSFGFKIGGAVEDSSRLQHFVWRLSKGDTVEQAGASVNKWLFNYGHLDPATKFAKNFLPFVTWSRFNLPRMAEHLVTDPGKATVVNKFRIAIEKDAGADVMMDERYVAEYIREGMAIRTRRVNDDEYEVFMMNNWIPIADLGEVGLLQLTDGSEAMGKKLGEWFTRQMSPFIKLPVETAMGYSTFLKRDFLPEQRRFLSFNLSERSINILRNVRYLSALDRWMNPKGELADEFFRTMGLPNLIAGSPFPQKAKVDLARGRRMHQGKFIAERRELVAGIRRAQRAGNEEAVREGLRELEKLREKARTPVFRPKK